MYTIFTVMLDILGVGTAFYKCIPMFLEQRKIKNENMSTSVQKIVQKFTIFEPF